MARGTLACVKPQATMPQCAYDTSRPEDYFDQLFVISRWSLSAD